MDIGTFYYKNLGLNIHFYTQKKDNYEHHKNGFPTAKANPSYNPSVFHRLNRYRMLQCVLESLSRSCEDVCSNDGEVHLVGGARLHPVDIYIPETRLCRFPSDEASRSHELRD